VLSGRIAQGETGGFLGRFHNQISVIAEDREREFLGWLGPGKDKFSVINTFVSRLNKGQKFAFSSSTNGSHRAMVPIGLYENVTPMDLMMTQLLRHVLMELDEEDLALSTFVCPCKNEYGSKLREILTVIESEG
jgi:Na+-transporting NADH:ubiquinone oxidoreductase subunit A